jgi:hypothetical protein
MDMPATAARKAPPLLEAATDLAAVPRASPPRRAQAASQLRLFHARMLVTRLEEWCVEAQTAEEARALLAAGAGHRCSPGDSVHVEFDTLLDD